MFKSILLTCFVAAVRAEAEADAYYPAYGYGAYAYGAYPYASAVPFGSSTGLDPITQGLDPVTQGVAIPAYGHYIGKRSADADADAYYGYPYAGYAYGAYPYAAYGAYASAVPFGSSTGLDPITQGLDPVTQGVAIPAYGHYIGKRSADADADAYYGYPYAGYAYGAYPYAAYGAYAAAVPFGSSTGLDPITQGLDPVTQGVAIPTYGHYIGKRSADANADAYYGYPYAGYAYGAYPYAAYGAYPYAVPFGSSTGLDPITQGLDPVTQGAVVYGK